jgi:cysteine desulfurase
LEHASVRAALAVLEKDHGAIIDTLDVGGDGLVSVADVRTRITADTVLVAVMWVNNVFGAVQPIAEIGTAVREERDRRGTGALPILFFSDAVQAMRTEDVRPMDTGVDIMTISAHKMYGPKGAGALWMRNGVGFVPTIVGGGQESARRSGTENLPAIVGFGAAASILVDERVEDHAHALTLRKRFTEGLKGMSKPVRILGSDASVVPGIVYVLTGKINGDTLAVMMDAAGAAVSSGSACDAGIRGTASAVGAVLGNGTNGIRFSFGRGTTEADIDATLEALDAALRRP